MRPFFLLVLGLVAAGYSSLASAQNTFGIRLGISTATLTGDFASVNGAERRTGFAAGIYGAVPLRYGIIVQPEILYMQKGFRPTDPMQVGSAEPVVELTYIEMPLLFKYPLYVGALRIDPYVGPFAGFELAERVRIDEVGEGASERASDLVSPDLGFVVGSDFNFTLETLDLVFGVRFSRGLRNILEPDAALRGNSTDVFTRTTSLLVGLNF
ncbi:MAG: outer membrane beta-barrel protein [Bacteroidota bacterium]